MSPLLPRAVAAAFLAGSIAFAAGDASAQSVEEFYKGKSVDLIISSGVGGGNDAYSRMMARYIQHHLPGNPTIVPRNMPGAGGIQAANFLYNMAKQDGTAVGQIQNTVPFQPLLGEKAAQFDADKFNYLGSPNVEVAVIFVWNTSPVKSFDDLFRRETIVAGSTGSLTAFYSNALNDLVGTKIKHIGGYKDAASSFLAVERGEAEGYPAVSWSTLKSTKPDWVAEKKIRIIVQYSRTRHPDLPDVPTVFDYLKTDEQRQAFDLILAPQFLGRPFITPPGVPADRVAALRQAFTLTSQDPEFLAEAQKRNLEIQFVSGADLADLVRKSYQTPRAVVEQVQKANNTAN